MRKIYLKINYKVHATFLRKARARPAQGLRKVRTRPVQDPRKARARPRPRPVLKKTSVSQMIDLVMTIQTVQESSKSELSSRFLSTSKFGPPRKTSAQGHARLFAQGQGWLIFSMNYCRFCFLAFLLHLVTRTNAKPLVPRSILNANMC